MAQHRMLKLAQTTASHAAAQSPTPSDPLSLHCATCPACTRALASADAAVADQVVKALHGLCGEGRALFGQSLTPKARDFTQRESAPQVAS